MAMIGFSRISKRSKGQRVPGFRLFIKILRFTPLNALNMRKAKIHRRRISLLFALAA